MQVMSDFLPGGMEEEPSHFFQRLCAELPRKNVIFHGATAPFCGAKVDIISILCNIFYRNFQRRCVRSHPAGGHYVAYIQNNTRNGSGVPIRVLLCQREKQLFFYGGKLHEVAFDKAVDIAVHHAIDVGCLMTGAVVFYSAVVKHV